MATSAIQLVASAPTLATRSCRLAASMFPSGMVMQLLTGLLVQMLPARLLASRFSQMVISISQDVQTRCRRKVDRSTTHTSSPKMASLKGNTATFTRTTFLIHLPRTPARRTAVPSRTVLLAASPRMMVPRIQMAGLTGDLAAPQVLALEQRIQVVGWRGVPPVLVLSRPQVILSARRSM